MPMKELDQPIFVSDLVQEAFDSMLEEPVNSHLLQKIVAQIKTLISTKLSPELANQLQFDMHYDGEGIKLRTNDSTTEGFFDGLDVIWKRSIDPEDLEK